ncbi:MAG: CidA/LrgA family protein [Spirochaetia bacterium]|jgi:holin-like protein|nr:CidA/LrgA family protein [Spirochaetia bacterium]
MKALRGMAVILGLLVTGEALSALLGLPVPGSVIGMALMALGLGLGVIRLEWVREAGDFLAGNLAFFFVPVGVGFMEYFDVLKKDGPAILGITVLSTLCVLGLTGVFHRIVTGKKRKATGRD